MKVLITGASGIIGFSLAERIACESEVIGTYCTSKPLDRLEIAWERLDVVNQAEVAALCKKYSPDVVIHCAAVVHRKTGSVGADTYMPVNSAATEHLARAAALSNPSVHFVFISSVSVYGDEGLAVPVSEEHPCNPADDYAMSKRLAEVGLEEMVAKGIIGNVTVLRLASVYDRGITFLLDRRVRAPGVFIRYGTGMQQISALARPNLVDFLAWILKVPSGGYVVMNVCDEQSYRFNDIIRIFRENESYHARPVVPVPLPVVRCASRLGGGILRRRRTWFRSAFNKASSDLVFSNERMLKTGFRPVHTLENIFLVEK
ncbi:MAG TPA: NAD-dependent epimerase/dehydratase family protein [Syntrophales bacterium]|nr:NAD-dependent epimerase/dehydratase family protein [Syntrophales bacterium]